MGALEEQTAAWKAARARMWAAGLPEKPVAKREPEPKPEPKPVAKIDWQPATRDDVIRVMRDFLEVRSGFRVGVESEPQRQRAPTVARIKTIVARFYGVTVLDMESNRRTAGVVLPRQVGMYFARQLTHNSLPEIGRRFGDRDHTTALWGCRKIEAMRLGNTEFSAQLDEIEKTIINDLVQGDAPAGDEG